MAYFIDGQITPYASTQNNPNLTPYERPVDWLPMPEVSATEEIFVGLFAVFDVIGNFVALQFEGDYTVDWGDGVIEDFASGVKAQHSYDYTTIDNSTLCSRGYKQVLVTVTPQAGQNLTSANLGVTHDNIAVYLGTWQSASVPWLDMTLSLPEGMSIFTQSNYSGAYGLFQLLEVFTFITSGNISDLTSLLDSCESLKKVSLFDLSNVNNLNSFFSNCYSLQTVVLPELPAVEDMVDMFDTCYSLQSVIFPTELPNLIYAYGMFNSCVALRFLTLPAAPLLEDIEYMFSDCYSLEKVSFVSLPSLLTAYACFDYCYNLKSAALPPTPNLSDLGYIFEYCHALKTASFSNLSSLTGAYIFSNCYSLESVTLPATPLLTDGNLGLSSHALKTVTFPDLSAVESLDLSGCSSLREVNLPTTPLLQYAYFGSCYSLIEINIDSSALNSLDYIANSCYSLRSFSVSDASQVIDTILAFTDCYSLASISLPGLIVTISVANCALSRDAIVSLFNDLGTASATIDVSGNYGVADLTGPDLAIATGKGWTVVV